MGAIIKDPLYKALRMLAERKAAWQKAITLNHPLFWLLIY